MADIFQSTQPSQAVTLKLGYGGTKEEIFQSTQPSQAVTLMHIITSLIPGFQSTQPSQAVTNYCGLNSRL